MRTKVVSFFIFFQELSNKKNLKEKIGQLVDFEFLTEMGSWGTNKSIPVGLRKILQRKVVENGARKTVEVPVFRAEMIVT